MIKGSLTAAAVFGATLFYLGGDGIKGCFEASNGDLYLIHDDSDKPASLTTTWSISRERKECDTMSGGSVGSDKTVPLLVEPKDIAFANKQIELTLASR